MTGIKEWNMRLIRVEEESALLGFRRTAAAGTEETLLKSRNICLSALIEAEAQRVLYALTMPEYLEAWLVLPDVSRIECHSEQRSFDRFRIDLFYSDRPRESIHGSCYLSKPNIQVRSVHLTHWVPLVSPVGYGKSEVLGYCSP